MVLASSSFHLHISSTIEKGGRLQTSMDFTCILEMETPTLDSTLYLPVDLDSKLESQKWLTGTPPSSKISGECSFYTHKKWENLRERRGKNKKKKGTFYDAPSLVGPQDPSPHNKTTISTYTLVKYLSE